jgi:hypothetical protein
VTPGLGLEGPPGLQITPTAGGEFDFPLDIAAPTANSGVFATARFKIDAEYAPNDVLTDLFSDFEFIVVDGWFDDTWDVEVINNAASLTIPNVPLERGSVVVERTTDTTTIPGLTLLAIDVSSIAGSGEVVLIVQYTEGASTPVRNYRRVNVTPDVTTVNMGIVTGAAAQISVWAVSVDADVDFTSTESVFNNNLVRGN